MQRIARPRNRADISSTLDHRLSHYAMGAVAASVGLVSLTVPADAKVVYTPTHKTVSDSTGILPIDFNHDGVQDAHLSATSVATGGSGFFSLRGKLFAVGDNGNEFLEGFRWPTSFAGANPLGKPIGPGQAFGGGQKKMAVCTSLIYAHSGRTYTAYYASGDWSKVTNRYLGFKFSIQGQTHYGWARVTSLNSHSNHCSATATLTGYAYETDPDKPILAGATSDSAADIANIAQQEAEDSAQVESMMPEHRRRRTLGQLAAGTNH